MRTIQELAHRKGMLPNIVLDSGTLSMIQAVHSVRIQTGRGNIEFTLPHTWFINEYFFRTKAVPKLADAVRQLAR